MFGVVKGDGLAPVIWSVGSVEVHGDQVSKVVAGRKGGREGWNERGRERRDGRWWEREIVEKGMLGRRD